ncbi:MAG: hypothetical protein ACO1TE_24045 [Prosthecobacter sp.]
MKTFLILTGTAALLAAAVALVGTPAHAQTVVVPAPASPVVEVPAAAPATVVVPAPADSTTTRVEKRTTVIPAPLAVPTGAPLAPVTSKTTTTTTARTTINGVVVSDGVVDVYEPGARFVVKEASGPVSYTYGPQTVYSTPGGVVLTAEQVTTRMRAGLPVRVEYLNQGNARVIQRVIIND